MINIIEVKEFSLSREDKLLLEEGSKYGNTYQYRMRCSCILLKNKGLNYNQIGKELGLFRTTVLRACNAFQKKGISIFLYKKQERRVNKYKYDPPKNALSDSGIAKFKSEISCKLESEKAKWESINQKNLTVDDLRSFLNFL